MGSDISTYLKSGRKQLYTKEPTALQNAIAIETDNRRRTARHDFLHLVRNITDSPMPPTPDCERKTKEEKAKVPEPTARKKLEVGVNQESIQISEPINEAKIKRLQRLKEWKQKREIAKEMEQKKNKPTFKWSKSVNTIPAEVIFSKPLEKASSTTSLTLGHKLSSDYKFKAPKNIKPMVLAKPVNHKAVIMNPKKDVVSSNCTGMLTRSKTLKPPSKQIELPTSSKQETAVKKPTLPASVHKQQTATTNNPNQAKKANSRTEKSRVTQATESSQSKVRVNSKDKEDKKPKTNVKELSSTSHLLQPTTSSVNKAVVKSDAVKGPNLKRTENNIVRVPFLKPAVQMKVKRRIRQITKLGKRPTRSNKLKPETVTPSNEYNDDVFVTDSSSKAEHCKSGNSKNTQKALEKVEAVVQKRVRKSKAANVSSTEVVDAVTKKQTRKSVQTDLNLSVKKANVDVQNIQTSVEHQLTTPPTTSTSSTDSTDHLNTPKFNKTQSPVLGEEPFKTPDRSISQSLTSPFITLSRGKNSARKEYKSRRSNANMDSATYFRNLLDNEISRLEKLCNEWTKYKDEESPPDGADDMINAAIGQTYLLINKKMQQFRKLIEDCAAQNTDPLVTTGDLHGFWDMVLIQVENIDKRFENLVNLRNNKWEEILPDKVRPVKKTKAVRAAPKREATSSIRDAIRAARNKAKNAQQEPSTVIFIDHVVDNQPTKNFDGGFFMVKSPNKQTPVRTRNQTLLKNVLESQSRKSVKGSPGLAILRASSIGKSAVTNTPSKSILKDSNSASIGSAKKTAKKSVLFTEKDVLVNYVTDEENEPCDLLNSENYI